MSIKRLTIEIGTLPATFLKGLNVYQQSSTSIGKGSIEGDGPNAILIGSRNYSSCNCSNINIEQVARSITIAVNAPRGYTFQISQ